MTILQGSHIFPNTESHWNVFWWKGGEEEGSNLQFKDSKQIFVKFTKHPFAEQNTAHMWRHHSLSHKNCAINSNFLHNFVALHWWQHDMKCTHCNNTHIKWAAGKWVSWAITTHTVLSDRFVQAFIYIFLSVMCESSQCRKWADPQARLGLTRQNNDGTCCSQLETCHVPPDLIRNTTGFEEILRHVLTNLHDFFHSYYKIKIYI